MATSLPALGSSLFPPIMRRRVKQEDKKFEDKGAPRIFDEPSGYGWWYGGSGRQAPENRGAKPTAELVGWWVNIA